MSIELIERITATGSRVDRVTGIIRGVKILGATSKNGRRYTADAMRNAVGLYEGAKVNVGHTSKSDPNRERSYFEQLGVLRNVHYREGLGLFGDLHANPKHALFEQLCWDAENNPENVGLSHNAIGKSYRENGIDVVERIISVRSVDLVTQPATVGGLFESVDEDCRENWTFKERLQGYRSSPEGISDFVYKITGKRPRPKPEGRYKYPTYRSY